MRRPTANVNVRRANSGAILVVALICLLLLTVLAASLTRTVIVQREQVIRDEWQLQAEWLAESALDRAAAQLQANPEYAGEEWRPGLTEGGIPLGNARIALAREETTNGATLIRIKTTADVPADGSNRARVERTTTVPSPRDNEN
jgi:Tfp pilus assembly protein PilX